MIWELLWVLMWVLFGAYMIRNMIVADRAIRQSIARMEERLERWEEEE